jgi:hypothetical protein
MRSGLKVLLLAAAGGLLAHLLAVAALRRRTDAASRTVPTRWEGRCRDYRELDRCRIPTRGVESWLLENGPFEYWRGQVTEFRIK